MKPEDMLKLFDESSMNRKKLEGHAKQAGLSHQDSQLLISVIMKEIDQALIEKYGT